MPIQAICPDIRCRHIHSFPDEARGQVIRCFKCNAQFRIPVPQKKLERVRSAVTLPRADELPLDIFSM